MKLEFRGYNIEGTPKEISEFLSIEETSNETGLDKDNYNEVNALEEFYEKTGCKVPQEIKDGKIGYR